MLPFKGLVMVARSCSLVHPHITQRRSLKRGETATPCVATSLATGVSSVRTHIPTTNIFPGLSSAMTGRALFVTNVYLFDPALVNAKHDWVS
jgi:hypothetical protein